MSQYGQRLLECLSELVNVLFPGSEPFEKQQIYNELANKIENQNDRHYNYDLEQIVNSYRPLFADDVHLRRFFQLVETFLQYRTRDQVALYLAFLATIKTNQQRDFHSQSAPQGVQGFASEGPMLGQYSIPSLRSGYQANLQQNYSMRLDLMRNIGRPDSNLSAMDSSNLPSLRGGANKRHRANFSAKSYDDHTLQEIIDDLYLKLNPSYIEESQMLEFISYTLLGSPSRLFPVDQSGKSIEIPDIINNNSAGLLHLLFEASLLYKWLLKKTKSDYTSQIKVAFISQTSSLIQQYVNLVNELSISSNSPENTLINIYRHLIPQIDAFRYLHFLINCLEGLPGNEFLSLLYGYTSYGDPLIKDLSKNLYESTSAPYYKILENWILNGELIDTNHEFFIKKVESKEEPFNNITGLDFDKTKFPRFLPIKTGYKIHQIGKIIVFLRDVCKEYNFLNRYNHKFKLFLASQNQGLKNFNNDQFTILINSQYQELTNYFTYLIYNNYKIDYHFVCLKKFLLLSKGDFISALFSSFLAILSEPSQSLSTIDLSKSVVHSLYNSSAKGYPRDTLLRIDTRILSLNSSANLGWDVFTLDYKLEDPLSVIIYNNYKGLKGYLKLFNFLWKLKRANFFLDQSWQQSNTLSENRLRQTRKEVRRFKLHKNRGSLLLTNSIKTKLWLLKSFTVVNIIKGNLIKFVTKLLSYLNFEVIDQAFKKLFSKLTKPKDLFLRKTNHGDVKKSKVHDRMAKYNRVLLPNKEYISKTNDAVVNGDVDGSRSRTAILPTSSSDTFFFPKLETYDVDYEICSIDEIVNVHSEYLTEISAHKLVDSSSKYSVGRYSRKLYIQQISKLIALIFEFIQTEEEYYNLVLEYLSIIKLNSSGNESAMSLDDNSHETEIKLKVVFKRLNNDLYADYKEKLRIFVKDLVNDLSLQSLALNLSG